MFPAADSLPHTLTQLRAVANPAMDFRVLPFGVSGIDSRLGAGGLRAGALHEAAGLTPSLVDDAAATLFLAGIAAREAKATAGPVLWASCRTDLYAPGLAQAGLSADNVIYAQPQDDAALLAVVEDAARDGTPSAIVAEASKVSMVATRRLQLVAAEADMPVLLLRHRKSRDQDPLSDPSAAWTRWRITQTTTSAPRAVQTTSRPIRPSIVDPSKSRCNPSSGRPRRRTRPAIASNNNRRAAGAFFPSCG